MSRLPLKLSAGKQYGISVSLVILASSASYWMRDFLDYRAVALLLLLAVSISAMLFDIVPVLLSALLSALILNFFFIPPTLTLNIRSAEDVLLFFMYFFIALTNTVFMVQIRRFERKRRDEEEKEKTIRLYNTLLNSLSHELRTPISTIIGAIDTIVGNKDRLSEPTVNELYGEIETATYRLNREVENLLNMSRLDAGTLKPSLDWLDINELIFRLINGLTDPILQHRISFEPYEDMSLIYTDGGFLETILNNLLHNAIQHTEKDVTIVIAAQVLENHLIVDISDNGRGFPKDEIARVFDKFYKLTGTATGGTGLGLSIVKGFTEALNGKVTLENKKVGGAHFKIEIPVRSSSKDVIDYE